MAQIDLRVAAYSVIVEDGRILLAHWNERGRGGWTLPGGGLEAGEDPADAAVREALEETGHDVELVELVGIDSRIMPIEERGDDAIRPLHTLRIVYTARVVGGELRNEPDGSTDEARWFDLAEVALLQRVSLVDAALGLAGLG